MSLIVVLVCNSSEANDNSNENQRQKMGRGGAVHAASSAKWAISVGCAQSISEEVNLTEQKFSGRQDSKPSLAMGQVIPRVKAEADNLHQMR